MLFGTAGLRPAFMSGPEARGPVRTHLIVEYLKLGASLAKIGIVTLSLIDQTMS